MVHGVTSRRFSVAGVAAGLLLLMVTLAPAADATATTPAQDRGLPTAAVSLGDSYIAGEAGRWEGNSSRSWGDRRGTDRAATFSRWRWRYRPAEIYGDSYANGCHRSDVAPLLAAGLAVDAVFNLACSGASTQNLMSATSGGASHNGEAPQVDQLASVAGTHDIEVVVVSIGGNDLGFQDIIINCVAGYVTSTRWAPNTCHKEESANIANRMPSAMTGVAQVLEDIHSVLASAGDTDYRLILQSYPAPLPEGASFRYAETGWSRVTKGGCPFWDADADWANQELIPDLTAQLSSVAASGGAEFLDLSAALKGREACSSSASQGSGTDAEWIRMITTGIRQGDASESAHPNALGQLAMGRCLALHVASSPGDTACTNTPGSGPSAMVLATR